MPESKPSSKGKKKSQGRMVLAGAVVGLLVYLYYKRKKAAAASSQPQDTIGTLPGSMPAGAESSTTQIGGGPGSFSSITAWMEHVQSWANSLGFDAATVQTALQHYQAGQCLTASEFKIIDAALALFGQPPQAPSQGVVQCQPSTPGTPAPGEGQVFLGSGFGPPGYVSDPNKNIHGEPNPTPTEEQVIQGLDGGCYQWIATPSAAQAVQGSGQVLYLEVAPHTFVPNITPVPAGTAAQYIRIPCPASGAAA